MKTKKHKNKYIIILLNIIMLIFVIIWLVPTLGIFISSFRIRSDINSSGWWMSFLNPFNLTLENYMIVFKETGILRAFINSIIITVPATILTLIIASFAAYPIAFYNFRGKYFIFILIIALQIVPIQITLIPVLRMLNFLNLSGIFPGVWLAHTAYGLPFSIFILRNFFSKIPYSLIEAVQIDGANKFYIFLKLVIPLSLPVFASLGIFQFLWIWNDLLVSLVFLGGNPLVAPLTVKIAGMMGSLESGWHIITTSAFISMAFPITIFLFLQRYFIKGILAGAIKG